MNIGPYRFAPPWWGVLIFLLVASLLCSLGVWQIKRGLYKETLVAVQNKARAEGPTPMPQGTAASQGDARNPARVYGHHYRLQGRYDASQQILMDNQVDGTQVGYRVWTPLITASGLRVMIDRGWVPVSPQGRGHPPNPAAPTTVVTVAGFWRSFPQPGLRAGDSRNCGLTGWPRTLNFPDAANVRCQYHAPVANGLLLLSPSAPNGFVRDWDEDIVGLAPFGHFAYASQWFLMAFVCLVILIVVNSKRRE